MIPLAVPNLGGNEQKYLNECIQSTFVSSVGPFVSRFEGMVARATGAKYVAATSSGTTALHLSLLSLGVEYGDLVILPSFTFIASANAISHCGAVPWLFDVSEKDWNLDPELLIRCLRSETKQEGQKLVHVPTGRRVAAIMPVYTLGQVADMDAINEIAESYSLPVIADAAAALGAKYKGRPLSELAKLSAISFNGNKTVTAGAGGAVVSNDEAIAQLAKHLCTTARVGQEYNHDRVGYNYRMTNLQAAVGCAQLERLDELVAAKRRIRATYDRAFSGVKGVGLFPQVDEGSTCWFSGVMIETGLSVPSLCEMLKADGIEARAFWKPTHLQPPYMAAPRTEQTVSERIWKKILTLPSSTHLSALEQEKVIATLTEILERSVQDNS